MTKKEQPDMVLVENDLDGIRKAVDRGQPISIPHSTTPPHNTPFILPVKSISQPVGDSPMRVEKTPMTLQGGCDYAIKDVCIADPRGPVDLYIIVDTKQQLHVCLKCFGYLLANGQWEMDK